MREMCTTAVVLAPAKRRNQMIAVSTLFLFLGMFLFLLMAPPAEAASMYVLRDDDTGGDCVLIGSWDDPSNTCTLNTDITVTVAGDTAIEIVDSGITLEGNGKTILGMGASFPPPDPGVWVPEYGVYLNNISFTKVRDLHIEKMDEGVFLDGGSDNTIVENQFLHVTRGIIPVESDGNLITGNSCGDSLWTCVDIVASEFNEVSGNWTTESGEWGVRLFQSKNNTITENTISNKGTSLEGTGMGVWILMSDGNDINGNTFEGMNWGVYASSGAGNQIVGNYFLGNLIQAEDPGTNVYDLPAPTGGNLWDDFDEPAEGCFDTDNNGFCDAPYIFTGNQDDLPLVGRPDISLYYDGVYWEDYTAFVTGTLSADYILMVEGAVDAIDVRIVGSVNTGGVTSTGALPILAGDINAGANAPVTMYYDVPPGTGSFWSTVYATAENFAGVTYEYPDTYPGP